MALFYKTYTISLGTDMDNREAIAAWCAKIGKRPDELPSLEIEVSVDVCIDDFDKIDILDAAADLGAVENDALERAYRLVAEGDCAGAMEIMHRELGARLPPSHQARFTGLLAGQAR